MYLTIHYEIISVFFFTCIIQRFVCYFILSDNSKVKDIIIKSGNLSCLELLQLLNKHVSILAPVEQPVSTIQTKLEKKGKKK